MLRFFISLIIVAIVFTTYAQKEDSSLLQLKVIEGKISPKSIVCSGNGLFFAQNMMYKHTITVYDRNFTLLKTISDKVELNKYGFSNREGLYKGAPVECTFTHGGKFAWVSNYNMTGGESDEFNKPGCDTCYAKGVYDSSYVYKINTTTLTIESIIKVGAVPKYLASTPDNKYVLVTNWSSGDLSVLDVEKEKEIKRIRLGTYPRGIEIDSSGKKAYIAIMGSSKIAVLDLITFEKTWIRDIGKSPRHLCMSPANDFLYVSINGEGMIGKIDLATNTIKKIKTGRLPRSMVLSDDGLYLYVVNYGSDKLTKVRTKDMVVIDNIATNDKPIGVTFDNETKNIWVACYKGSIMVFHDSYYDSLNMDAIYDELLEQNSEEIDFRKSLAENEITEKEVKLDDKINETESRESYFLIAGSFKNKQNAEAQIKELTDKGYNPFIYYNSENGYTYACVDSYTEKEKAINKSNQLKKDGLEVWMMIVNK